MRDVILKAIKDLSVFSSLPIDFEVEWHSSRSDKWYQSQGHMFESRECYCEGGIVRGGHNLTPYNYFKNRLMWCSVESHKRFECIFLIINWFWDGMTYLTVRQAQMIIIQMIFKHVIFPDVCIVGTPPPQKKKKK